MLRAKVHDKATQIKEVPDGLDFYFSHRNHSTALMNFLQSNVPHKIKDSKELVSHDVHTSVYNYKFSYMLEMPKICKDDLIIMPKSLCKELGGVNPLGVCMKVTNSIHLYDPVTLRTYQMNAEQYFKNENDCDLIQFRGRQSEFLVVDVQADRDMASKMHTTFNNFEFKFAHVDVQLIENGELRFTDCYFGNILKHGDVVLGYDVKNMSIYEDLKMMGQKIIPDVVLIRKEYPEKKHRKRLWKLKRMDIEKGELTAKKAKKADDGDVDMEELMNELEQNKGMRKNVDIIRDEKAIKERKKEIKLKMKGKEAGENMAEEKEDMDIEVDDIPDALLDDKEDREMIRLAEMIKEMNIDDVKDNANPGDEEDDRDINQFVRELGAMNIKDKK